MIINMGTSNNDIKNSWCTPLTVGLFTEEFLSYHVLSFCIALSMRCGKSKNLPVSL